MQWRVVCLLHIAFFVLIFLQDTGVLAEVGATIYPDMKRQLASLSKSGIKHFGRFGIPVHDDLDMGQEDLKLGRGLTNSLGGWPKKNWAERLQFCVRAWGVVIETRPNTVWVFNGRHEHGTVMPSESAYHQNLAESFGTHPTFVPGTLQSR
ncbi:hypothetical protein B0H17DRAFT_1133797 [Mycena rosella]|uniref:Uncharacterized protein n=1 Tax=Mycena rosella TaxID=1033263 RepID=A0AAD7DJT5_MYCRO|nr:hypothetical protein B0H17DRAFT_1133797 [Mycena rosella]